MTIDDAIRQAARRGDLKSLTLWRLTDGRWQANASEDGTAWFVQIDPDPAVAVARALRVKIDAPEPGGSGAFD